MRNRIFIPGIGFFLILTLIAILLIAIENNKIPGASSYFERSLPAPAFFSQYGLMPSE